MDNAKIDKQIQELLETVASGPRSGYELEEAQRRIDFLRAQKD